VDCHACQQMPGWSLYPSQKWQMCGESCCSTNLEINNQLSADFIMCVYVCWDQLSGGSKTPVTLRDSTNKWSGMILWSLIVPDQVEGVPREQ